ncbi:PfkB family carbohydrate kinase [Clostridium butyricum]
MDVVTFGESMIVFSPKSHGPLRHVHTFEKTIGGAESNVATALSKLNHTVGWFSKLSNDEFGRDVISSIRAEGVDTSRVILDENNNTGLIFKDLESMGARMVPFDEFKAMLHRGIYE